MEQPDNLFDLIDHLIRIPAPSVEESPTSTARAIREDRDGTTSKRQKEVLNALKERGVLGLTWKELGWKLDLHHGQSSGVLSSLHRAGLVFALKEARGNCQPYVHGSFRHLVETHDRVDSPVQTKSGKKRARLEELADAVRIYLHYPTDDNFKRMKVASSECDAE
jgi:hypothetical protein